MDRTVIEQMLMPVTYGRHLARRDAARHYAPGASFAIARWA